MYEIAINNTGDNKIVWTFVSTTMFLQRDALII